ncbi:hypothetical protein F4780DRAFT_776439 [Xylariomycetidae sp. FL0641]|nr:hypothetical protein F4780DRAFT_776439 [Xylariomycetidae sp. FL0641]
MSHNYPQPLSQVSRGGDGSRGGHQHLAANPRPNHANSYPQSYPSQSQASYNQNPGYENPNASMYYSTQGNGDPNPPSAHRSQYQASYGGPAYGFYQGYQNTCPSGYEFHQNSVSFSSHPMNPNQPAVPPRPREYHANYSVQSVNSPQSSSRASPSRQQPQAPTMGHQYLQAPSQNENYDSCAPPWYNSNDNAEVRGAKVSFDQEIQPRTKPEMVKKRQEEGPLSAGLDNRMPSGEGERATYRVPEVSFGDRARLTTGSEVAGGAKMRDPFRKTMQDLRASGENVPRNSPFAIQNHRYKSASHQAEKREAWYIQRSPELGCGIEENNLARVVANSYSREATERGNMQRMFPGYDTHRIARGHSKAIEFAEGKAEFYRGFMQ